MEPNQYLIDFYNQYDEEQRLTVRYGRRCATCERPDLLGITSHALDIFRK